MALRTFLIFILFINCKNNEANKQPLNIKNVSYEEAVIDIAICKGKKQTNLYKGLVEENGVSLYDKLGRHLYYAISKENFNALFYAEKIKCIVPFRNKKINVFEIYYADKELFLKSIFFKIKTLKRNDENLKKYHDFFKRGLVFILNQKENKITIMSFNLFKNNSLSSEMKDYFSVNKNKLSYTLSLCFISD